MSAFAEDNDGSESSNDDTRSLIQLGFAEKRKNPLFNDSDWTKWDGGIIGGLPVWLNYEGLPALGELLCNECNEPLTFLLQIYSPLDHIDCAFHRALYVFCCKKPSCVASSRGFKCLRSQLSRNNSLYCSEPESLTEQDRIIFSDKMRKNAAFFCRLCGCKATNSCSQCKVAKYCSRQHQRLHWKSHKAACQQQTSSSESFFDDLDEAQKRFLFPSYEIVVEAEPLSASDGETVSTTGISTSTTADILQQVPASTPVWEDAVTAGGADEEQDAKLTQADYNKALSENRYDPVYISFLTRMQRPECGQQILRYCDSSLHHSCSVGDSRNRELTHSEREQGRLYVSKAYKELAESEHISSIPKCSNCGSPRAFEFQIMPQLLHYLGVEKNTKIKQLNGQATGAEQDVPVKLELENKKQDDLDWGTIDIFTCIGNCSPAEYSASSYLAEHVELQQLPDLIGGTTTKSELSPSVQAVIEK